MTKLELDIIGVVRGGRSEPVRDNWGSVRAVIELDKTKVRPRALVGLDEFSHIEVIYQFHRVPLGTVVQGSRHPRDRTDLPDVGIYAQRGRNRPNRLGVTVCNLVAIDGLSVVVEGLDAIDDTPVLDIKPYISGFAPRGDVREPAWAKEVMGRYW